MDLPSEEMYFQSPALNHLVPSSPHLFHHPHSPFQNVPDVDRTSRNRVRFGQDSPGSSQASVFGSQYSQPQRLPATPVTSINSKRNKEILEQVVPNCSPFISSQTSTSSKSHNIGIMVPNDEKPPIGKVEMKRKNRIIPLKPPRQSQAQDFFESDEIFD